MDGNTLNQPGEQTVTLAARQIDRSLHLIGRWTAALQGQGDLAQSLDPLFDMFPLVAAVIFRSHADDLSVKPVLHRVLHGQATALRPVRQAIGAELAVPGTVFVPERSAGAGRVTVQIALGHGRNGVDILELQLRVAITPAAQDLLVRIAAALAGAWTLRQPGVITSLILAQSRRHRPNPDRDHTLPILDYTNPYALSRSEFRVCSMIGQGLTAKRIARELHLSEATVRSHQRSIYAKTALSGQVEVMFHLQSHPPAGSTWPSLTTVAAC